MCKFNWKMDLKHKSIINIKSVWLKMNKKVKVSIFKIKINVNILLLLLLLLWDSLPWKITRNLNSFIHGTAFVMDNYIIDCIRL